MKFQIFIFIVLLGSIIQGCTKTEPLVEPNPNIAGLGGNVEVIIFPSYNGASLTSQANYLDSVYIKLNTKIFPGNKTSMYDMAIASDQSDHIHVRGLKMGDYYFYVTGFDVVSGRRVTGSVPFTVSSTSGLYHLPAVLSQ